MSASSRPQAATLDPAQSAVDLTEAVCNITSVSGAEGTLADAVEAALRGTSDMKGGVAVALKLACELAEPVRDVTYLFYDCEEIEAARNGLGHLAQSDPDWMRGDFAILMEPTNAQIEGGCKGTLRVTVATTGVAAHSGRPWLGKNAIHAAGEILDRLRSYAAREVDVDGLTFHEGMSAVRIEGGHAMNVIPDRCVVWVNYRFAPDLSVEQAVAVVRELFDGFEVAVDDSADGARPGLHLPAAADFVAAMAVPVLAKEGWTDVARFTAVGVPAVNFGPGDPAYAHKDDEFVAVHQIEQAYDKLRRWLTTDVR